MKIINNYSKITKNKNKIKRWTNAMKFVEIKKNNLSRKI